MLGGAGDDWRGAASRRKVRSTHPSNMVGYKNQVIGGSYCCIYTEDVSQRSRQGGTIFQNPHKVNTRMVSEAGQLIDREDGSEETGFPGC